MGTAVPQSIPRAAAGARPEALAAPVEATDGCTDPVPPTGSSHPAGASGDAPGLSGPLSQGSPTRAGRSKRPAIARRPRPTWADARDPARQTQAFGPAQRHSVRHPTAVRDDRCPRGGLTRCFPVVGKSRIIAGLRGAGSGRAVPSVQEEAPEGAFSFGSGQLPGLPTMGRWPIFLVHFLGPGARARVCPGLTGVV